MSDTLSEEDAEFLADSRKHTRNVAIVGVVTVGALVALVHWWPSGKGTAPPPSSSTSPPVASPEVHGASPSTAAFVPGAARLRPLVRTSRWHAFPPGIEIVTRLRHGRGVQVWSVAPDGVTLTATSEPIIATPDLLARADADLLRARWIGPRHAFRDPHMGAVKTVPAETGAAKDAVGKVAAAQDVAGTASGGSAVEALAGLLALREDR